MDKLFCKLKSFLGIGSFRSHCGFSMIELSIFITITASATVAMLSWTQAPTTTNALKAADTTKKMKEIQKAVDSFRAQKKRLPCPADPLMKIDGSRVTVGTDYNTPTSGSDAYVNSFGMEDIDKSTGFCPVSVGAVPVYSLNLDDTYINDGWGNRFTYHVADIICGSSGCDDKSYQDNMGNITVTGGNTTTAAYVLVSHGINGKGAFLPSGVKLSNSTGTANEIENSNGDKTYVTAAQSINFDDIVLFETKAQIESLVNRKNSRNISVTDCEANSQALKMITMTEAATMNTNIAGYTQTSTELTKNSGDQAILNILKATQSICVSYYGAVAAKINNQTWSGAQCPGNNNPAVNGSTYISADDSCTCASGLWDGNCSPPFNIALGLFSSPYLQVYNANWNAQTISSRPTVSAFSMSYSTKGDILGVVSWGQPPILYRTSDYSVINTGITAAGNGLNGAIAFSPNDQLMAVGNSWDSTNGGLIVFNTSNWSKVTLTGGFTPNTATGAAFSPNGMLLAATSNSTSNDALTVYNTSNWSKVTVPGIKADTSRGIAFSPNSAYLAIIYSSSSLTVYRTSDWSTVSISDFTSCGGGDISFSPNGNYLAITGKSPCDLLVVYNTSDWSKVNIPGGTPYSAPYSRALSFSKNSANLAVGYANSPSFYFVLYNTADWSFTSPITTNAAIYALAFSPN